MSMAPQPLQMLILPEERVIVMVGAGGKTTLMYALAEALVKRETLVLVTTTTRMYPPVAGEVVLLESFAAATNPLAELKAMTSTRKGVVTIAQKLDVSSGKLVGLNPECIGSLRQAAGAGRILVEADGAAGRLLKVPAGHEPVVPKDTELCIGIMNLAALGQPFNEATVFRSELAAQRLDVRLGEPILPCHLLALSQHPSGLFQGCPTHARRQVFLNQADLPGALTTAQTTAHRTNKLLSWAAGTARDGWYVPLPTTAGYSLPR
ncbi:Selenium-dependent hydroxylase accessory protein YqeC [Desulfovibrionales bacterium]